MRPENSTIRKSQILTSAHPKPGNAPMHIDLTDLRLFVNIADTASITRGAQRSHLSLPSASARVRGMEAAVGVLLLERRHRGVRLLPAGENLLAHARNVLAEMEKLKEALHLHAAPAKGQVRLLSNTAALYDILPDVLVAYLSGNPEVFVDVDEQCSEDIAEDIAGGKADVGILSDAADLSALEILPLRADELVLVVPDTEALARRASVRWEEVQHRPFIGLRPEAAFQRYVERRTAAEGSPMKIRCRAPTFDTVCDMVAHGIALGLVPLAAAKRRASKRIRTVSLGESWATRTLAVGVRDLRTLSPAAQKLVEQLRPRRLP